MRPAQYQLRNLYHMATLDGQLDEEEKNVLFQMTSCLKLTQAEFREALLATEPVGIEVYPSEKRFLFLYQLVQMMLANGTPTSRQMDFCLWIGEKMGYGALEMPLLMQTMMAAEATKRGPLNLWRHLGQQGFRVGYPASKVA